MPKVRQQDIPTEYEALNRRPPNREYIRNLAVLSSLDPAVAMVAPKKLLAANKKELHHFFEAIMELEHRYEIGEKRPHMGLLTPFTTKIPEIRPHLVAFTTELPTNLDPDSLVMVDVDLINLKQTTLITFDGRERQMWKPPISMQEFRAFMQWRDTHKRNVEWELSDIPDSLLDEGNTYDARVAELLLNGPIKPPSSFWPSNANNFKPSPGALNQTGPLKAQGYPNGPSAKSMISILRSTSTQSSIDGQNGGITGPQNQTINLIGSSKEKRPQSSSISPAIRKKQRGWGEKDGLDSNPPKQPHIHSSSARNTVNWPRSVQSLSQNTFPGSSAAQLGTFPATPTRGVSNLASIGSYAPPFLPTTSTSNNTNYSMQTPGIYGDRNRSDELPSTVYAGQRVNPNHAGLSPFRSFSVPNRQSATMPSAQDIASKKAQISAQLTAGGTNAQMKDWYIEYQQLVKELEAAKAMQTTASKTTYHDNSDDA